MTTTTPIDMTTTTPKDTPLKSTVANNLAATTPTAEETNTSSLLAYPPRSTTTSPRFFYDPDVILCPGQIVFANWLEYVRHCGFRSVSVCLRMPKVLTISEPAWLHRYMLSCGAECLHGCRASGTPGS